MISLLSRLRDRRPKSDLAHWHVTVYSRAGCGCCEKALAALEPYRRRHGFAIEVVDIDPDPALKAAYDTTVPVVAINGKVRFKGRINPVLLDRLIEAERRGG
jgi:glutaredoxin